MRIVYFTKYTRNGASSRLRSYQYYKYLSAVGFECIYHPLHSDRYLKLLYSKKFRGLQAIFSYFLRLRALTSIKKSDIIFIEKELFPYMPPLFEYFLLKFGFKFIVDYDDAIHHNYDKNKNILIKFFLGNKISKVMRYATLVIVGNKYLYDYATKNNVTNITVIPTVIDENKYFIDKKLDTKINIGWIGTPVTSKFLKVLIPLFQELKQDFDVKFTFIGALQEDFQYEFIKCVNWQEDSEVELIQSFDIGIMPLGESFFDKGKCGYKLIQYMACGIPVIASPIGENKFIVDHFKNGYLATTLDDWRNYLIRLISDRNLRNNFGYEGHIKINDDYTIASQGPKLIEALTRIHES